MRLPRPVSITPRQLTAAHASLIHPRPATRTLVCQTTAASSRRFHLLSLPSHHRPSLEFIAPRLKHRAQSQPPYHKSFSSMATASEFYNFKPLDKKGKEVPLSDYRDKVVLVVNTASKCGFTPQYAGLEKLWKSISEKSPGNFAILGFPCNQFGGQEPGSDDDIQQFCQVNYGVTFPIMAKVDVNGDDASPLFQWLKAEKPGLFGLKRVKWNFEKILVDHNGQVIGRWASTTKPESLEPDILEAVAKIMLKKEAVE